MQVSVIYAGELAHAWIDVTLDNPCSIQEAIERSGLLGKFPEIDLKRQKVGVFGKFAKLDAPIEDGFRIEIYRPIIRNLDDDDDEDDDD